MAKTKSEEVENTLPAGKVANAPAVIETETGVMDIDALFEQIEKADLGQQLGSDYFKLEVGESDRVIFVNMTEIAAMNPRTPGEMTEAARFITKDKRYVINADRVIVTTCKGIEAAGRTNVPLEISCIGEKFTKKGFKYKDFSITELVFKSK